MGWNEIDGLFFKSVRSLSCYSLVKYFHVTHLIINATLFIIRADASLRDPCFGVSLLLQLSYVRHKLSAHLTLHYMAYINNFFSGYYISRVLHCVRKCFVRYGNSVVEIIHNEIQALVSLLPTFLFI